MKSILVDFTVLWEFAVTDDLPIISTKSVLPDSN